MTFKAQALMAQDQNLLHRVAACAAAAGVPEHPVAWVNNQAWQLVVQPGWGVAYAAALAAETPAPGLDESVITDEMICTAVNDLNGAP